MNFEYSGSSTSHHQFDCDVRGKIDARNVGGYCVTDSYVISDVSGRPIDDANGDNIVDNDARDSSVTPATTNVGVHAKEHPLQPPGDDPRRLGVASDDGANAVLLTHTSV